MAYQSFYLFGMRTEPVFLAFVFCGTVCSYNFHWWLTPPAAEGPVSLKNRWNLGNRRLHLILAIMFFIASAALLVLLRQHLLWLAGAALVTFLYSAPKIPGDTTRLLRKIAYGKTIFLALAWTYITAMLPLLISLADWEQPHYLFCINRFFLIYAICILFDLRDRERDQQEGIRSLVTQLPVSAVHFLYWGVVAVFFITSAWLAMYFPFSVILALTVPGLIISFLYGWFRRQHTDFVYYFILDGLMAFSMPLLLVFWF